MDINWRVPFEFALDLSLFIVGATLVLVVAGIGLLIVVGVFKGLVHAIRSDRSKKQEPEAPRQLPFPVDISRLIDDSKGDRG
jgi:hypothetical protein